MLYVEIAQQDVEGFGGLAVVLGDGCDGDGVLALEDGVDVGDLGLHLGDGGGEGDDFGVLLLYLTLLFFDCLLLFSCKHKSFGKSLGNSKCLHCLVEYLAVNLENAANLASNEELKAGSCEIVLVFPYVALWIGCLNLLVYQLIINVLQKLVF